MKFEINGAEKCVYSLDQQAFQEGFSSHEDPIKIEVLSCKEYTQKCSIWNLKIRTTTLKTMTEFIKIPKLKDTTQSHTTISEHTYVYKVIFLGNSVNN